VIYSTRAKNNKCTQSLISNPTSRGYSGDLN